MAIKKEGAVSSKKKDELIISVGDLSMKIWNLESDVSGVIEHFKPFYNDMTWSKYGDIVILKEHIPALIENLKKLLVKIEKGDKA